jgi:sterol desaturase/sphingolipid hydroxylase (fatty acid hydroxylase superfamily)
LNDAITNINCGVTSQVTGAFLKVLSIGVYTFAFQKFAFFNLESSVWIWIVAFIAYDFFYYWAHRMSHQVNLFWGGHSVHHQSEEYNLSVALRQSSTQTIWTFLFYMPMALVGIDPIILVSVSGFNLLYQFWIHTESINKLPVWFEAVFNTPSHHRVHHAKNPLYIDTNFCVLLPFWDWLFGTLQTEKREVKIEYGITRETDATSFIDMYFGEFICLYNDLRNTKGFRNKVKMIIMPPGWYPDSTEQLATVVRGNFLKQNPVLGKTSRDYLFEKLNIRK